MTSDGGLSHGSWSEIAELDWHPYIQGDCMCTKLIQVTQGNGDNIFGSQHIVYKVLTTLKFVKKNIFLLLMSELTNRD